MTETYTLYLAGKMRGLPDHGFQAFFEAALALRGAGHVIHNPAEHDMAMGFNPYQSVEEQGFDLEQAFGLDVRLIMQSQGVVLLPGWEDSSGSKFERAVCAFTGKKVFLYDEKEENKLRQQISVIPDITFPPPPNSLAAHVPSLLAEGLRSRRVIDMGNPEGM